MKNKYFLLSFIMLLPFVTRSAEVKHIPLMHTQEINGFVTQCRTGEQLVMQVNHFNKGWRTITLEPVTFDEHPVICKGSSLMVNGNELSKHDLEIAVLESARPDIHHD
jgi:hypothetical protein